MYILFGFYTFGIYNNNISFKMQGKIKLGYWELRGRGQVLRLLLAYSGLDWQEVTYKTTGQWFVEDKTKLGFDFPNLPYLINGDFKLTQSSAIARYIINKSGKKQLLGKDTDDQARVDMILSLLEDIYNPTYSLFFSPNYQKEKTRLFDSKIKAKLNQIVHFIGKKEFVLGYLTLIDFKIAQATYYFQKLFHQNIKDYPELLKIRKNVQQLPEVKKFYSNGGIKGPFLPTYSQLKF